jgi:putative membrane protein
MNGIPWWARRVIRQDDRKKIADAIAEAEKSCGAEFVPVIVRRSSAVGHIDLTISLALLLGLYVVRFRVPQAADAAWQPIYYPLAEAVLAIAIGWILAKFTFVQRLFTPRLDRHQGVDRRARLEFYKHHVESSKTGEGILLFISLMERQAVLLCGKKLSGKVPQQSWHEVTRLMSKGASKGRLGDAMAEAISMSAEIVRKHLPKRRGAKIELKDRLVIKE